MCKYTIGQATPAPTSPVAATVLRGLPEDPLHRRSRVAESRNKGWIELPSDTHTHTHTQKHRPNLPAPRSFINMTQSPAEGERCQALPRDLRIAASQNGERRDPSNGLILQEVPTARQPWGPKRRALRPNLPARVNLFVTTCPQTGLTFPRGASDTHCTHAHTHTRTHARVHTPPRLHCLRCSRTCVCRLWSNPSRPWQISNPP
ncbi:hypothetical protein CDEST_04844 [Colletotrichum destructivum]|uniref:Uncharacterized protein n=1 Tax=Colletotrichum destructivum TaxID=34406 RepID=A0AAX4IA13_9PEZI|nr:hypothetical protein CDEST_04844 [Colletotrichum destructivum]